MDRTLLRRTSLAAAVTLLVCAAMPSAATAVPFTLGTGGNFVLGDPNPRTGGNQPDAFTDVDGVTHVVWDRSERDDATGAGQSDSVIYCRVPRGARDCGVRTKLLLPPVCSKTDTFNGGRFEGDRPRVLVSRFGDVRVVTHARCRTSAPGEADRFADQTVLYTSSDDGTSFGEPERTLNRVNLSPDNTSDYVYDEADSRLVGVQTVFPNGADPVPVAHGVYVIGNPDPAAAKLSSAAPSSQGDTNPQLVQRGRGSFVAAWLRVDNGPSPDRIRLRTFDCAECPLDAVRDVTSWGAEITLDDDLGVGSDMASPSLVDGPSGTVLLYATTGSDYTWWTRRITGSTVGPPRMVTTADSALGNIAQDPATGRLHVAFDRVQTAPAPFPFFKWFHLRSDDGGATWGAATELDMLQPTQIPVVTANTGDDGFSGMVVAGQEQLNNRNLYNYAIAGEYLPGQGEGPPDPPVDPPVDPPAGPGDPGAPGAPGTPGAPGAPGTPPGGGGGGGAGGGGGGTPSPPAGNAACRTRAFGPLELVADACLQVDKQGVIVARGTVKLNGLTLAGKEIRFDPKQRLVESVGPVSFRLGDTKLFSIPIDWKLPAGSTFTLPAVGLPDAGRFLGFPLQGSVDVKLVRGGVELPLHLGLPALFGGFTGDVTVRADNVSGIRMRELKVRAGKALLGPVELDDVTFEYNPDEKRWAGGATVLLPPKPPSPALTGKVAFAGGELESLFGELEFPGSGIPLDSFKLTHLTKIRFAMETKPTLKLVGGVSFGAGERFGPVRAVEVDGDMTFLLPTGAPATLRADGTVKLLSIPIGRSYAQFRTDGEVSFGGNIDYTIGTFGVKGAVDGWVLPPAAFSVKGAVGVCLGSLGCQGGEVVFSSKGMAACAKTSIVDFGAGYEWGPSLLWTPALLLDIDYMFSSCSVADYEVARPPAGASIAQAGATRPVVVEQGLPSAVIGVTGTNAVPRVALVSPGGQRIELPAGGPLKTRDAIAFDVAEENTTFFVVRKPAGGTWKVESLDATPIASVGHAEGLPDPKVVTRVQGSGRTRVLRYAITPLEGQKVRFEERAKNAAGVIGTPRAARGTLRFSPASGPAGRRDIVAVVESFGKPRGEYKVGSYVAPPPARPVLPKQLRVKRAGTRLVVSWAPQAGLSRYQLVVKLTDGRSLLLLPRGKARRATLSGFRRTVGARVALNGQFATGVTGPAATGVLKASATKKPKRPQSGGRPRRSGR